MSKKFIFLLLIFSANQAFASCFIEEALELYAFGYTEPEIEQECQNRVEESHCSLTQVINLAKEKKTVVFIIKQCQAKESFSSDIIYKNQQFLQNNSISF